MLISKVYDDESTGYVDSEDKKAYHDLGFNIEILSSKKIRVDENGRGKSGKIYRDQEPLSESALKAKNWGIAHTTDPRCDSVLFIDWDRGEIPPELKKFMISYRKKPNVVSYHGIIKVEGADKEWISNFCKNCSIDGLEVFKNGKTLAMMGEYEIKDTDETSKWFWVDDMRRNSRIISISQSELVSLFRYKKTKKTSPSGKVVPANVGERHDALILECYNILGKMKKNKKLGKNMSSENEDLVNTVMGHMLRSKSIESMSDYADGEKAKELQKAVEWAIDHFNEDFFIDDIKLKSHFAHIRNLSTKDQFNLYVWRDNRWTDNTAHYLLEESKKRTSRNSGFGATEAEKKARDLSADPDTLQVNLDDTYRKKRMRMVIDDYGNYFDFESDRIRQIDPTIDFFENPDVRFKLQSGLDEPKIFIEFLKERFGKDWEIVRDHIAGALLHPWILRSKPKMLFIVGKKDTYKSFLLTLIGSLFNENAVSHVSLSMLSEDIFAPSRMKDRIFNFSEEEEVEIPKKPSTLKDVITRETGTVRIMRSDKGKPIIRFPRLIVACNVLAPIGRNDDDDSIFTRNIYVETLPVGKDTPDYRKLIDDTEKQKILMYLLHRAHEITSEKDKIVTQNIEITKERYKELTTGTLETFISENYEPAGQNIGVSIIKFRHDYKNYSGKTMQFSKLKGDLSDLGYECVKVRCGMVEGFVDCYDTTGEGRHLKIILGLKPKEKKAKSDEKQSHFWN